MRILIKEGRKITIKETEEVRITSDGNLGFPKLRKQYLTGDKTEKLFQSLLQNGYADVSNFESKTYRCETLL